MGARAVAPGILDWESVILQGGVHRCFSKRVGSSVRWRIKERGLDTELHNYVGLLAVFLVQASLSSSEGPTFPSQDGQFIQQWSLA